MNRLGRCLGQGKLERVQRGSTPAQYRFTYTDGSGKRRRVSLSTDKRIAETMARELLHRRDRELLGLEVHGAQDRPLAELVATYLADLGTRACARHVVLVRRGLEATLAALPIERVGELKPLMLIEYRARRLAAGVSVRTANLDLDRLRACLAWCVKLELVATNPVAKLPRLKENEATARCRRRALSEPEIEAFLVAAREDDRRIEEDGTLRGRPRVRQYPLWRSLLETGARYGELTRVAWSDVDLDRGVLLLRAEHTKAGRSRKVPILAGLVGELRQLRAEHVHALGRPLRPEDRVYLTPRGCAWCGPSNNLMRAFDRILEAAGIDRVDAQGRKVDIHALRHTLASRLARTGAPLIQAQRILGHSDPKLTARVYAHLDVEDLRGAVEGIASHARNTIGRDAAQTA
ncbi:MAG: site-specific integrase [Planctomycetes bacterium]|nr:site-specific integrase [Planctomycetota bacterium]